MKGKSPAIVEYVYERLEKEKEKGATIGIDDLRSRFGENAIEELQGYINEGIFYQCSQVCLTSTLTQVILFY